MERLVVLFATLLGLAGCGGGGGGSSTGTGNNNNPGDVTSSPHTIQETAITLDSESARYVADMLFSFTDGIYAMSTSLLEVSGQSISSACDWAGSVDETAPGVFEYTGCQADIYDAVMEGTLTVSGDSEKSITVDLSYSGGELKVFGDFTARYTEREQGGTLQISDGDLSFAIEVITENGTETVTESVADFALTKVVDTVTNGYSVSKSLTLHSELLEGFIACHTFYSFDGVAGFEPSSSDLRCGGSSNLLSIATVYPAKYDSLPVHVSFSNISESLNLYTSYESYVDGLLWEALEKQQPGKLQADVVVIDIAGAQVVSPLVTKDENFLIYLERSVDYSSTDIVKLDLNDIQEVARTTLPESNMSLIGDLENGTLILRESNGRYVDLYDAGTLALQQRTEAINFPGITEFDVVSIVPGGNYWMIYSDVRIAEYADNDILRVFYNGSDIIDEAFLRTAVKPYSLPRSPFFAVDANTILLMNPFNWDRYTWVELSESGLTWQDDIWFEGFTPNSSHTIRDGIAITNWGNRFDLINGVELPTVFADKYNGIVYDEMIRYNEKLQTIEVISPQESQAENRIQSWNLADLDAAKLLPTEDTREHYQRLDGSGIYVIRDDFIIEASDQIRIINRTAD